MDIHVHVKKSVNIAEIDIEKKCSGIKKKVMRGVIENRKLIPAMSFLQNFTGKIFTKCQKRKCCQYYPRC